MHELELWHLILAVVGVIATILGKDKLSSKYNPKQALEGHERLCTNRHKGIQRQFRPGAKRMKRLEHKLDDLIELARGEKP